MEKDMSTALFKCILENAYHKKEIETNPHHQIPAEAENCASPVAATPTAAVLAPIFNSIYVAAHGYGAGVGRVYILPPITSSVVLSPPGTPAGIYTITGEGGGLGEGGVTVVDFDGGGIRNDVAVAAAGHSAGRGMVYILPNVAAAFVLPAAPPGTITITGELVGPVGALGRGGVEVVDFDGVGGTNDVIVAAHLYNTDFGRVYIIPNPTTDVDLAVPGTFPAGTIRIIGESTDNQLGYAGVTAVDFDDSGIANDIVVAAHRHTGPLVDAGKVYIILNPTADIDLSIAVPITTITITGEAAGNELGLSAVTVVDFDGGGVTNDVIIEAPAYTFPGPPIRANTGRVYIIPNLSTGDIVELNVALPAGTITITGEASGYTLGLGGVEVVDFDGDGLTNDIVITAANHNSQQGRVYIIPNLNVMYPTGGAVDLSDSLTYPADTIIIIGESPSDYLGWGGTKLVNFDGDGVVDDLIVSAFAYNGGVNTGRVYVIEDIKAGTIVDLSSGIPADTITITGETGGDQLGYGTMTVV